MRSDRAEARAVGIPIHSMVGHRMVPPDRRSERRMKPSIAINVEQSCLPLFTSGGKRSRSDGEMQAWLRANQLWQIVSGNKKRPSASPDNAKEIEKQEDWDAKADQAIGWIFLMVEPSQTVHLQGIADPVAMWEALKSVHLQQKPGARFNAYDDLFSIRKTEEEFLQTLVNRVDAAIQHIKNLCPKNFTLDNLDDELLCMAMIRSLPEDYSHFVSSLMLSDKLDKSIITQAFHTEEIQRTRRSAPQISEVANKVTAVITTPIPSNTNSTCNSACTHNHNSNTPFKKQHNKKYPPCSFCGKKGHFYSRCPLYLAKSAEAKAATAAEVQESAGKASIYTLEELENPFLLKSNYDWNADTGATSHMTPHRHWLRNYKPLHIAIRLADHTIIYSAGIGSILFIPIINGVKSQPLLFSRVLHVPQLQNNLLSLLYLTKHKGYNINIDSQYIHFIQSSRLLFTATINSKNAAFLDGCTAPASLLNMVTKHLLHRPMDLLLYLLHRTKWALTYFTSYLGQYCSYYFDSWTQGWRMTQTRYSGHLLSRLAVSWHNRNKQMPNPYMSGIDWTP